MSKQNKHYSVPDLVKLEEKIQKFWEDHQIFEKSVSQKPKDNSYVFYDGPPFATGLPHYGHILASTMKDVMPRYFTMKGKRVERRWGWDCHGLPIENIAEKELGISQKKEIEKLGVKRFNEICRSKVLSYVNDWKIIIKRLGRWADMDNDYKTMDLSFMESVWWVFKTLHDNDLIYEDYRSMHICPRCETTLSQSEVAEGYKNVKDLSVTAEFLLLDPRKLINTDDKVYILAWTTTPWTLPGNFLLAINPKINYVLFSAHEKNSLFICAESRLETVLGDSEYKIVKKLKGAKLIGQNYGPLFPYYRNIKNAFRIVTGNFVSDEEGTGIVHIAPGFGDDDYKIGKKEGIELIQHVGMDGRFTKEVTDFAGHEVKPRENPQKTDIEIIKYLAKKNLLWDKKKITHSYPHCWRCDTPLLNYATGSYFVNVLKIKNQLLKNAKKINWSPNHIKNGRWGKWLEGARDWSISRQRFWASVIPIWKCKCGQQKVYGNIADLEKDSDQKITDLHKHIVDKVTVPCNKCGKQMHRVPDVLDTWFDSGSMPYGQAHYPFEDKEKFEKNFPAEFIGEGIDQTRAWFYYLHVIAGGVKNSISFKNVVVNGIVLAENGEKMSKRLKNYPDPVEIINKHGADSLRLYLTSSPVLKAEDLNFSEKEVASIRRKVFIIWWNTFSFYQKFCNHSHSPLTKPKQPQHVLDKWLLSKLNSLIVTTTNSMDSYDMVTPSRELMNFVSDLSTWYLRLSRNRLKNNKEAGHVFAHTLYTLAQLFAPFCPFFSETIHHLMIDDKSSIHLTDWPKTDQNLIHIELEEKMTEIKKAVELAHSSRQKNNLKLRQPLAQLTIVSNTQVPKQDLLDLLAQETNVKKVTWQKGDQFSIELDRELTPELKQEGKARELMRSIQNLRRQAGLSHDKKAEIVTPDWPKKWQEKIEQYTNTRLKQGKELKIVA